MRSPSEVACYNYPVQGEVVKKYAPKYANDTFFCQLLESNGHAIKAMVHESHYAKFDVGDTIGVDAYIKGSWLKVREATDLSVIERAMPEVKDLKVGLGYVSDPKLIGEDFWYLAKVGDSWFRIPYSVASKYWLGDQNSMYHAFQSSYYALLDVGFNADNKEIHQAWKYAARQHHPDLFPPEQRVYQGQVMTRINAAHDCLMDDGERARYDAQLAAPQTVDQAIKAWPGRGFGTLRCLAEVRGDSFLVTKIISWATQEVEFEGSIAVRDLRRVATGLRFDVTSVNGVYAVGERVVVGWEHLPTQDWGNYDISGNVWYHIQAIRSGHWDWENKRVVRALRVREATFEWPEGF